MSWDHTLVVTPEVIRLAKRGDVLFEIDPKQVISLHYAGTRYPKDVSVRNAAIDGALVGGGAGAGFRALYAHFAKEKKIQHLIAIEYVLPSGMASGVLLRPHKTNHAEIFDALSEVTEAKLEN